ncbi:MAG: type V CRISPR-associated protein Cas12d/CasY, partial [candidate division WOR-3 bacterium]
SNVEHFEKIKSYLDLRNKNEIDRLNLSFILQRFFFSELKGAITLLSKKEYLAKYTLQLIGSDNVFRLFYCSKNKEIDKEELNERKELVKNPHFYLVCLKKIIKRGRSGGQTRFINFLKKGELELFFPKEEDKKYFFKLASSPYQLQFLDKFIYPSKKWEDLKVELGEWSLVLEKKYKIKWSLESEKMAFEPLENSSRNKLYLVVPFILSFQEKGKYPLKKLEEERLNYPILGVDIGEYGLAWVLADFKSEKDSERLEILNKGFLESDHIRKIKDSFASIQRKAKKGMFEKSSSLVFQVRQNAVGSLRNEIHNIIIKQMASPIYESSISNFETGSGRVTKIYDSIKRADVRAFTDAEKKIHNHVWGKGTKLIGREISAYASSYICSSCERSLYEFEEKHFEENGGKGIKVDSRDGNIIVFDTPLGKVRGYSKDKEINFSAKNGKDNLKKFLKILKDFARPPIFSRYKAEIKSEVLAKFTDISLRNKLIEFSKRRGNSAIFICPFCQHLSDADIQAAFMMAIRGYLSFKNKKENSEAKEKVDYFRRNLEFLRNREEKEKTIIKLDL